jgi:signal transduction histidine kinase
MLLLKHASVIAVKNHLPGCQMKNNIDKVMKEVEQLQERLLFYEQLGIMGKMILCAAHELNSTLDEIKGDLSLVQEKENVPEEVAHHLLSGTMKGLDKMSLIIRSLLSYANSLKTPRTNDNLLDLLQQTLETTTPQSNK